LGAFALATIKMIQQGTFFRMKRYLKKGYIYPMYMIYQLLEYRYLAFISGRLSINMIIPTTQRVI
jgi:hypothetical protein